MAVDYQLKKEQERERNAAKSLAGRDIAPMPKVADEKRKEAARLSFQNFCESYFPEVFTLAWSDDHLKALEKIELAVLKGMLFAYAMPRGSGKTTLAETASLWALLYGHREFVCLIGASEEAASEMLNSIKGELENNELLAEDFPEVCYPITKLEGIANRTKGQIYNGDRTHIVWTGKQVVLPTIKGSQASGGVIQTTGLTGRVRGMKFKTASGKSVRPSLVIVDDPQTDESSRSPSQCAAREAILAGAVLGLAGAGKKIAGIMPTTVIRRGDMADRILNRDIHPDWQGERTKLVYRWPESKLWQKYAEIRAEHLIAGGDGSAATDFYKKNREEMDLGAEAAWPDRFNEDEVSAIQHAWNLRLRDEDSFFAEYQNDPQQNEEQDGGLSPDEIISKCSGFEEHEVPLDVERLTAFVDVQGSLLYYVITGWSQNMTGYVLTFGAWPDQGKRYFTLSDAHPNFNTELPSAGYEAQLLQALSRLVDGDLFNRKFKRDDGSEMSLDMLLIDANYGQSTDIVYRFARTSANKSKLFPSHGRYTGASSQPFSDYKRKKGERIGLNWRIPAITGKRAVRYCLYDTNYWKSFIAGRFRTSLGDAGSLSVFKCNKQRLQMFADQMAGEYAIRTTGRGREVDEWKARPDQKDNHFFDCIVGTAVVASMLGCDLIGRVAQEQRPRKTKKKSNRVSYL